MITKTRPTEVIEKLEPRHDVSPVLQIIVQTAFNLFALYAFHVTYIHIWRMMTGH